MVAALTRFPILAAALVQIVAAGVAIATAITMRGVVHGSAGSVVILLVQCATAVAMTLLLRLPVWWVWIAAGFPLALHLTLQVDHLQAWPFGVAFALLFLLFSNTAKERVPLYLTNRSTVTALRSLMEEKNATRFLDLGSGLGDVVRGLHGDGRVARGVETAPLSWLISWGLSKLQGRGTILRQDIWQTDISGEDVVYAFLSPEPMPRLWQKASREMKAGAILVSNSFAVPDVEPTEVWELSDRRKTRLLIYRMAGSHEA